MSLDKAVQLLKSGDITNQKNGCALVINNAATATNVSDIIRANILSLLIPLLNTTNDDLKMRICWVVNNLCVHDSGRDYVNTSTVVNEFPALLRSRPRHTETIQKISWGLTNLARLPAAMRKISSSGTFAALVEVLKDGEDEQKFAVIQPLCNLVLGDGGNQEQFRQLGGIRPVIALLDSHDQKVRELAVTLLSFLGSNHDSVRNAMLHEGVLKGLNRILNGDGTERMQELALNALVALSLSSEAENAIMEQGSLKPVVGLLSSHVDQLKEQAAMLLSNLLTNEDVRKHIRYLSWCDPMTQILQTGNQSAVCQVTRCIVNITFDEHCRYMCVKAGLAAKLKNAASRVRGDDVNELCKTACSNMEVGVSANVSKEVEEKIRTGQIQKISAPTSSLKEQKKNDFEGLDDLLGNASHTSYNKQAASKSASKPSHQHMDDLDSLLDGPSSKPANKTTTVTAQNTKSQPAKKSNFDDLDDLLGSTPSKPAQHQSKPTPKHDDLDDLLGSVSAPNKSAPKTQTRTAVVMDDLDDLLGDLSNKPAQKPAQKQQPKNNMDDIDSLLADMQPPSKSGHKKAQDDDIDSLLADLGKNSKGKSSNNEIDDLLADLL